MNWMKSTTGGIMRTTNSSLLTWWIPDMIDDIYAVSWFILKTVQFTLITKVDVNTTAIHPDDVTPCKDESTSFPERWLLPCRPHPDRPPWSSLLPFPRSRPLPCWTSPANHSLFELKLLHIFNSVRQFLTVFWQEDFFGSEWWWSHQCIPLQWYLTK